MCLILQVFSDQLLLKDVLARSDRALGVVKDLFGDAPRKQTGRNSLLHSHLIILLLMWLFGGFERYGFTGHPSVTMAPKCDWDPLPVHQRLEPPTRLSLMDQKVCKCLKTFMHVLHFNMLNCKFIFPQVLNEADMWEDEYSDEDSCPTACSDYHVIQRYWWQMIAVSTISPLMEVYFWTKSYD